MSKSLVLPNTVSFKKFHTTFAQLCFLRRLNYANHDAPTKQDHYVQKKKKTGSLGQPHAGYKRKNSTTRPRTQLPVIYLLRVSLYFPAVHNNIAVWGKTWALAKYTTSAIELSRNPNLGSAVFVWCPEI